MSLQKYRADVSEVQSDGAKLWFAEWLGGHSLAKIEKCRWETLHVESALVADNFDASCPRVTVYITGERDTYSSQPAKCRYLGKTIAGYVTGADYDGESVLVFRHVYY